MLFKYLLTELAVTSQLTTSACLKSILSTISFYMLTLKYRKAKYVDVWEPLEITGEKMQRLIWLVNLQNFQYTLVYCSLNSCQSGNFLSNYFCLCTVLSPILTSF